MIIRKPFIVCAFLVFLSNTARSQVISGDFLYLSKEALRKCHLKSIVLKLNGYNSDINNAKLSRISGFSDSNTYYKWNFINGVLRDEIPFIMHQKDGEPDSMDSDSEYEQRVGYLYENGKIKEQFSKEGAATSSYSYNYIYKDDKIVKIEHIISTWMNGCCNQADTVFSQIVDTSAYKNIGDPIQLVEKKQQDSDYYKRVREINTSFSNMIDAEDSFCYDAKGRLLMILTPNPENHPDQKSALFEQMMKGEDVSGIKIYDTSFAIYHKNIIIGFYNSPMGQDRKTKEEKEKEVLKSYTQVTDKDLLFDNQHINEYLKRFVKKKIKYLIIEVSDNDYLFFLLKY